MNAVFYQNEKQQKAAQASLTIEAKRRGISTSEVKTKIIPVKKFTYAEAYHQKYYLTQHREIRAFLSKTYPDAKSLADSAVATRLNAYLGSGFNKNWKTYQKEQPKFGIPSSLTKFLPKAPQKKP